MVLAGKKASVLQALPILEEYGPSLGIFVNLSKCELFSHNDPIPDEVATIDAQLALMLHLCGNVFKLLFTCMARATPPSLVSDPLPVF